ncbi:type II and III secretion system protein family protein [Methylovirgula sp. 4M-Z18]|nr:type II and III secretion system protein family protein [Methylovirgula sp. 4M-Z18]
MPVKMSAPPANADDDSGPEPATMISTETGEVRQVSVVLNKSRTIKLNRPFSTAVVGQPEIADVMPLTDSSIYIQGKKAGTTNVSIYDPKQKLIAVLDLSVVPDTAGLHSKIQASTGGQNIHVSSANGEVVLSGEAADAVAATRALAVAKGLSPDSPVVDAMQVAPTQQVMLKVRFLEATRDAGRDLGVNWLGAGKRSSFSTGLGSITNSTTSGPLGSGTDISGTFAGAATAAQPFGSLLASVVNSKNLKIDAVITALESKGLVKRLAEPDLIALSGDTASFLAGGEIPIPVAQNNSNGGTPTVTVEYKPFGVQLTFMPTVRSDGIINLRLAPSVSEIDTTNSVQFNGFTVPTLVKREARTTVELRDGQSFAIAGLLQSDNEADISQLPWLGSLPVLGALFRSTSYQKHETDLVIIVTPHLVKPAAPGTDLATPYDQSLQGNDVDLFLNGQPERKKAFSDYVTAGGEVQGPYGDIVDAPATYVKKKGQ